jgi:hypothetical protein
VVAPGGALRVGQAVISSTFSSGPVLHAFNVTAAADGWSVRVVHTSPSHVSITGSATDFSVSRDYLLAADGRVLINDTISARPGQGVVGVQVRHSLWSPELFIHGASGAGSSRYATSCATFGISASSCRPVQARSDTTLVRTATHQCLLPLERAAAAPAA